jgi:hypothetical protein
VPSRLEVGKRWRHDDQARVHRQEHRKLLGRRADPDEEHPRVAKQMGRPHPDSALLASAQERPGIEGDVE